MSDLHLFYPAVPVFDGDYLVVSQGMSLIKVPFTSKGTPIYFRPLMTATSVDVDCFEGKMYWTDTTGRAIRRSDYSGAGVETFLDLTGYADGGLASGRQFPEGIAIDWVARNIYWTDSGKRVVEVASLDKPNLLRKVLVDARVRNPRGVALDPTERYTYNVV